MKIKTIGYGEIRNLGNYENAKFYLEAELADGEDAREGYDNLKQMVAAIVGGEEEVKALERTKTDLQNDVYRLEDKVRAYSRAWENAKTKWNEAVTFLKIHGVELQTSFPTDPWLSDEGKKALGLEVIDLSENLLDDGDDNDDDENF